MNPFGVVHHLDLAPLVPEPLAVERRNPARLLVPDAEELHQPVARPAAEEAVRILILIPRKVAHHQRAARRHERLQPLRHARFEHDQHRADQQTVFREVRQRFDHVQREVARPERTVEGLDRFAIFLLVLLARTLVELMRPETLPVPDHRRLYRRGAAADVVALPVERAQLRDVAEDPRLLCADVIDHRAVKLLQIPAALPPLEVEGSVGAVTDRAELLELVLIRPLQPVARLPVGRARRRLHDQEGLAVLHRAVQVVTHRALREDAPHIRIDPPAGIDVVGDEVAHLRHSPVIQPVEEAHHVGRHRNFRRVNAQRIRFELHEVTALEGGKPFPVERIAFGTAPRRDLRPVGVEVTPEGVPPRAVQILQRPVPFPEPDAKTLLAEFAEAFAVVFVRDVPGGERRMMCVPFRQLRIDLAHLFAVDRRTPAVVVAVGIRLAQAVFVNPADLRIRGRQPGGFRPARRREDHVEVVFGHAVHDPVEPVELIFSGSRFEHGPAEDADREGVAAGFLHEFEVAVDDLRGFEPLIRIVVAAVQDLRRVADDRTVSFHRFLLPIAFLAGV